MSLEFEASTLALKKSGDKSFPTIVVPKEAMRLAVATNAGATKLTLVSYEERTCCISMPLKIVLCMLDCLGEVLSMK